MFENQLAESISLNGKWLFSLENHPQEETILVPGAWEVQGYSMNAEGPVVYRKHVHIPSSWQGKTIRLEFGAVSYACRIWCNGTEAGSHLGLWTPFAIDLTDLVHFGQENQIELEIYKPGERYPMRASLAGFLPDVATTFGGIWQDVNLRAYDLALEDVWVQADYRSQQIRVHAAIADCGHEMNDLNLHISVRYQNNLIAETRHPVDRRQTQSTSILTIDDFHPWSPQDPSLYHVEITIETQAGTTLAQVNRSAGFRSLSISGQQVYLNDIPVLLRGVLSWGWNHNTVAPVFTDDEIRREFHTLRAMGFNMVKLCLFLPEARYFAIADEEGMLLWEEFPMWLPQITPHMRAQAPLEYADYMRLTREHPSVVLYSMGCELQRNVDAQFVEGLMAIIRSQSIGALVCDNSGSGESYGGDFDFADFRDYHPYYDLQYFEPLLDHWRRDWLPERPWIFGEFNDSDGFRDLDAILAANEGVKPWWMTAQNPVTQWRPESVALLNMDALMAETGIHRSSAELSAIAARQSFLARKYTMEALRRRKGICGYVVTGLIDTPIATSGVLDDFGQPKWLPSAFQQINTDSMLLLETPRKRRWVHGGDRPAPLDCFNFWAGSTARWHVILSHFGSFQPRDGVLHWQLADETTGEMYVQQQQPLSGAYRADGPQELSQIQCILPQAVQAKRLRLSIRYESAQLTVQNDWPIWIYPPIAAFPANLYRYDPSGILDDWKELIDYSQATDNTTSLDPKNSLLVITALSESIKGYLNQGGRVLLLQQGTLPLPARRVPFFRESLKLFYPHPIWDAFPVEDFADMQFFGMAPDCAFDRSQLGVVFDPPYTTQPILQRLDERLFAVSDYIFEAHIGKGRMLACSLRLQAGVGSQPADLGRNIAGLSLLHTLLWELAKK